LLINSTSLVEQIRKQESFSECASGYLMEEMDAG
jgi:hypothetical protein